LSIHFYDHGQLSSGFVGFRVVVAFNKQHRQAWFSTKKALRQDESDFVYKRAHLQAQIKDAELSAESALHQYKKFVSTDHPNTSSERGVGVHCLTLQIRLNNTEGRNGQRWEPGFLVSFSDGDKWYGGSRLFTFFNKPYSQAWRDAVLFWGEKHGILDEDIQRVLNAPPEPERFKLLRRVLNEGSGAIRSDRIPIEVLEPVFREKRQVIALQTVARKHQLFNESRGPDIEDIALWFEQNGPAKQA